MNINDEIELQQWASRPFASSEAQLAAFADPRYTRSADFRAAIAAKLAISDNGIAPVVHNTAVTLAVSGGGLGAAKTEAAAELAAELKTVEAQMIERYGRTSVAPAPPQKRKELTVS